MGEFYEWEDEDESGRGEIDIEDYELEGICDEISLMVRLATYAVRMEHEDIMIKRGKKNGQQNNSTTATANGLEFLGVKHLTDDKGSESSKFEIVWAGTPEAAGINNKFKAPVAVKVQRVSSGVRYWWTLTENNPNLDTLCDEMGDEEKEWFGRHILIHTFTEQPSEKKFVRCEILAKQAAAAKK